MLDTRLSDEAHKWSHGDQHYPLAGITVIDLSHVYNGPYAAFLMAMAGAEVIKVEPRGGEHLRSRGDMGGADHFSQQGTDVSHGHSLASAALSRTRNRRQGRQGQSRTPIPTSIPASSR